MASRAFDKYDQVMAALAKGQLAPVYCLYGPQRWFMTQVVEAVRKAALQGKSAAFNHDRFLADEVEPGRVIDALMTVPMMGPLRLVEVGAVEKWKADQLAALEPLLAPDACGQTRITHRPAPLFACTPVPGVQWTGVRPIDSIIGNHRVALALVSIAVCIPAGCGGKPGTHHTEPVCGNHLAEESEQCDGTDLAGASCTTLGLGTGDLACTTNCSLDTSACRADVDCGNGIAETGESCDGTDLSNTTCAHLGFTGGQLACSPNCNWDTSNCSSISICGNGVAETPEQCDGTDLAGNSCQSVGG